jgi:hypothetical protein
MSIQNILDRKGAEVFKIEPRIGGLCPRLPDRAPKARVNDEA